MKEFVGFSQEHAVTAQPMVVVSAQMHKLNMGLFGKKKISWEDDEDEVIEVPNESKDIEEIPTKTEKPPTVSKKKVESTPREFVATKTSNEPRRVSTVTERLNRLSINQRMQLMSDIASSVIEGHIAAALIGGSPGLGKTHEVVEVLLKRKYKRVEHEDYLIIRAGVSAFGVYKLVVQWAEKALQAKADAQGKKGASGKPAKVKIPIIVFDDVPIWSDKRMVDLLKALMDTSDRRIVSWLTDRAALDPEEAKRLGKLPAQVEFTGGVIVITNEEEKKMNSAILDRTMYLPIEVTDEEMMVRMRTLIDKVEPKMDKVLKRNVLEWLLSDEYEGQERSMRTLVKALKLARANPKNWKRMVQVV
jgi:hypothetical protein